MYIYEQFYIHQIYCISYCNIGIKRLEKYIPTFAVFIITLV